MKLLTIRRAALLALAAIAAGAASGQDVIATVTNQWEGFYLGANIGGAWNTTCNTWSLNNVSNPTLVNDFNNRNCPNNSTFIGGVNLGYNFQYNEWVWGFGLDYDIWSSKNKNRSYTYTGAPPPSTGSTFSFNGKGSPNGIILLGPRVGYAVDNWLPYIKVGGAFTSGSHNSTSTFSDGATGQTASFSGGKNFKANGIGASIGSDFLIADQLFFRVEYTYVNLGKGSTTVTQCTGSAAICNQFQLLQLNNIHNSFTASLFRVGLNYQFK